MKKIIALLIVIISLLTLCSCGEKSAEEKLAEDQQRLEELEGVYDKSVSNYNKTQNDFENYNNQRNKLY